MDSHEFGTDNYNDAGNVGILDRYNNRTTVSVFNLSKMVPQKSTFFSFNLLSSAFKQFS